MPIDASSPSARKEARMSTLARNEPWGPGFEDAVLGRALPAGVEAALRDAGAERADATRTMAALMRAQALAPDHPAVLIALYRHHFYGHRLAAARDVARRALVVGAEALGLPRVWREVARRALPGARHDASTRFYLFALKGYAYLSLRLADEVDARDALRLLQALDPEDTVGASLLERVRRRATAGDDEEQGEQGDDAAGVAAYVQAAGVAAWSWAHG